MRSRPLYALVTIVPLVVLALWVAGVFRSPGGSSTLAKTPATPFASVTAASTSPPVVILQPTATEASVPAIAQVTSPPAATLAPTSPVILSSTVLAVEPTSTTRAADTAAANTTPLPTWTPLPARTPERIGGPVTVPNNHPGPRWVTLQAGHWRNEYLPQELHHLTAHTGASAAGVEEVNVNVAVARLAAQFLEARGYNVDILDATVPISYTTDLFLALHADGSPLAFQRGFKAVAPWGGVPASEQFVGILYEEYGKATGLPTDARTSVAMADYYAFNPDTYRHALSAGVPAALIEMGFITNPIDRRLLATEQNRVAWGIANGVDRYFRSGAAGNTPTPYPSFTPTKTPTGTPTSTPTPTYTPTPTATSTATTVPTEVAPEATETAALITPVPPTRTPPPPRPTATPVPTSTPLAGIITADGRWLPPLSPNGRSLPPPGSNAAPVFLGDATESLPVRADGRERQRTWDQYYMPELGRSIWKEAATIDTRR